MLNNIKNYIKHNPAIIIAFLATFVIGLADLIYGLQTSNTLGIIVGISLLSIGGFLVGYANKKGLGS